MAAKEPAAEHPNPWPNGKSDLIVNLFDIKAEAIKEGGFSKIYLESIS